MYVQICNIASPLRPSCFLLFGRRMKRVRTMRRWTSTSRCDSTRGQCSPSCVANADEHTPVPLGIARRSGYGCPRQRLGHLRGWGTRITGYGGANVRTRPEPCNVCTTERKQRCTPSPHPVHHAGTRISTKERRDRVYKKVGGSLQSSGSFSRTRVGSVCVGAVPVRRVSRQAREQSMQSARAVPAIARV